MSNLPVCPACGHRDGTHDPDCREVARVARVQLQLSCDHRKHPVKQTTIDPPGPRRCGNCGLELPRGAHCFEACEDGSLIIWATMADTDGEPIRIDPHRVAAVLAACGDALAQKPSRR